MMVDLHRPSHPQPIVVKPRKPRPQYTRAVRCLWPGCGARLAKDHLSPVCTCHLHRYELKHDNDEHAAWLVRHLLVAAYPDAIDISAVLRAHPDDVKRIMRRVRAKALMIGDRVTGLGRGYLYVVGSGKQPSPCRPQTHIGARTVKAKLRPEKGTA